MEGEEKLVSIEAEALKRKPYGRIGIRSPKLFGAILTPCAPSNSHRPKLLLRMDKLMNSGRRASLLLRILAGSLLLLSSTLPLRAQIGPASPQSSGPASTGTLVVTVRDALGSSLANLATVTVYTTTHEHVATATASSASARFPDLLLGTYIVEASAPGYETTREEIELRVRNDQQQVLIALRVSSVANPALVVAGPSLLTPKIQKQLSKALEELRSQQFDEARKNLKSAQKGAPNHPDVNYLLGLLASLTGNPLEARSFWEKAISFEPNDYFSLLALGEAALGRGELEQAKSLLNRASAVNPNAWRPHELLAHIDLRQGLFADAQKNAERAIDLGKGEANAARLVLAKAFIAQHQKEKAISTLQVFLEGQKTDAQAASAKKLLEALNNTDLSKPASASPAGSETSSEVSAVSLVPPPLKWMPAGVDEFVPPVAGGTACDLEAVLAGTQKRVLEFVKSLDSFSATELLEHQVINNEGLAIRNEERRYNYLVSIKEVRPGVLDFEEYRNGTLALDVFPDQLATRGLPSVILIFHPINVDGYQMSCEGLGSWHGMPAWQIHFRQKDDRKDLIRVYWIGAKAYTVPLKGRAWISADTMQVVRIETDLREPLPQIKLLAEHQGIDYGPVRFKNRDVTLWLPSATDLYLDFHGRRIHRRHTFTNFLLFSVDEKQKIQTPKTEPASN